MTISDKQTSICEAEYKWAYYEMTWDHGPIYTLFSRSLRRWPILDQYPRLAKSLGYTRLETDNTLVGGYFVNDKGDCFLCVPAADDPASIYG